MTLHLRPIESTEASENHSENSNLTFRMDEFDEEVIDPAENDEGENFEEEDDWLNIDEEMVDEEEIDEI